MRDDVSECRRDTWNSAGIAESCCHAQAAADTQLTLAETSCNGSFKAELLCSCWQDCSETVLELRESCMCLIGRDCVQTP